MIFYASRYSSRRKGYQVRCAELNLTVEMVAKTDSHSGHPYQEYLCEVEKCLGSERVPAFKTWFLIHSEHLLGRPSSLRAHIHGLQIDDGPARRSLTVILARTASCATMKGWGLPLGHHLGHAYVLRPRASLDEVLFLVPEDDEMKLWASSSIFGVAFLVRTDSIAEARSSSSLPSG